jgi:hypothetical protein
VYSYFRVKLRLFDTMVSLVITEQLRLLEAATLKFLIDHLLM